MNKTDYYHEIALEAQRLADEYTEEAAEIYQTREGDKLAEELKEDATDAARHRAFRDSLGELWTATGLDPERAATLGRIIALSDGRFRPEVEGKHPRAALGEAAEVTIQHDIRTGAFDMINKRLVDRQLMPERRR